MPTVLEIGPYSFVFFSSDQGEPVHIHVKHNKQIAKFWLNPISMTKNRGFKEHELNRIAGLVEEHQQKLIEAWNEYFSA